MLLTGPFVWVFRMFLHLQFLFSAVSHSMAAVFSFCSRGSQNLPPLFVFSLALPSLFSCCGWVPGRTLAQTLSVLALRIRTSWFGDLSYFLESFKLCFCRARHTLWFCSQLSLIREPLLYTSLSEAGADWCPWFCIEQSIFLTKRSSVHWHSCLVSFLEC